MDLDQLKQQKHARSNLQHQELWIVNPFMNHYKQGLKRLMLLFRLVVDNVN